MKFKTKKEMNLHELIKWAWENNIENKTFVASEGGAVKFVYKGGFKTLMIVESDETFTVEVEEEITEETIIPRLLEVYKSTYGKLDSNITCNSTINKCLEPNDDLEIETLAIYKFNDDASLTLIWKDGEMVE